MTPILILLAVLMLTNAASLIVAVRMIRKKLQMRDRLEALGVLINGRGKFRQPEARLVVSKHYVAALQQWWG